MTAAGVGDGSTCANGDGSHGGDPSDTGDHTHADGHSHGPRIGSAGARHQRALTVAFVLTATYATVEVVAGVVTGSLALISDAAHMGTDVLGLGLALAAIRLAKRPAAGSRTYGTYRLEVLAAVINGLLLFGVGGYVFVEAVQRFRDPHEVPGVPMLVVAAIGLVVNVVSYRLLVAGSRESLNIRGAYLEVLSDMLGSVGVIVGAVIITITGWRHVDAIIAVVIGLMILPRTWLLMRQAVRILMEVAPPGLDLAAATRQLGSIPGVTAVHDLHIWTITSGMEAATVHIVVADDAVWHDVLDRSRRILLQDYGVTHPTIQLEPGDHVESPVGF